MPQANNASQAPVNGTVAENRRARRHRPYARSCSLTTSAVDQPSTSSRHVLHERLSLPHQSPYSALSVATSSSATQQVSQAEMYACSFQKASTILYVGSDQDTEDDLPTIPRPSKALFRRVMHLGPIDFNASHGAELDASEFAPITDSAIFEASEGGAVDQPEWEMLGVIDASVFGGENSSDIFDDVDTTAFDNSRSSDIFDDADVTAFGDCVASEIEDAKEWMDME